MIREASPHTQPAGSPAISPRLLSLRSAATYLGVSYWSVRDDVLAAPSSLAANSAGSRNELATTGC